jgi:hypothetical protein
MRNNEYIISEITVNGHIIPVADTHWSFQDRLGAIKVRWALNRYRYTVNPGLYGIGRPGSSSRVFVTSNYKLSFDHLRTSLDGEDAWILVLDTKGINVWCAGGKGTFGTDELMRSVESSHLNSIVSHRKLILPQLGATGVSAYKVKELSGYSVIYGPVRARDIREWLTSEDKSSSKFRQVRFNMYDRLILTGVEISSHFKYLVFTLAAFYILAGFNSHGYSMDQAFSKGNDAAVKMIIAFFTGTFLTPLLLPFVPFRAFSLKGGLLGLLMVVLLLLTGLLAQSAILSLAWAMIMIPVSSFLAMNFTGSSPITNLSGVLLEVKRAVPFQIGLASAGVVLFIVSLFLS